MRRLDIDEEVLASSTEDIVSLQDTVDDLASAIPEPVSLTPVYAAITSLEDSLPNTKAEFNSELSDGDFLFVGDVTETIRASNLPPVGEYIQTTQSGGGTTTGTLALAVNRCDIFPWTCPRSFTSDLAAINVTVLLVGGTAKIVLYSSDSEGKPSTLLAETATFATAVTGVKTVALAYSFVKGTQYWLGLRGSGVFTVSTWAPGATPDISGGSPVTSARKIIRKAAMTYANAALDPFTYTSAEINNNAAPAIWLRRA